MTIKVDSNKFISKYIVANAANIAPQVPST